jgi:MocE subfamily Rieske [2Fe-2S] domain protein
MKMPRDYTVRSGFDKIRAVALDDDQLEERVEGAWWSPQIERKALKALMIRTDAAGLAHFGLWFLLLAISAPLAWMSWGTWWAVPAFLLYGTIYSSSDARWHECGHGTVFRTRWINEIMYHISSFMTIREAYLWRWSHARHHTSTIMVGLDPEIQVQRPADLLKILMDFFDLRSGPPEVWRVIRHAFANPNEAVRNFVPENERWKMYWSSRVYVAIWLAFIVWGLAIGSFLPVMFVALPRFYGGWLHQLLGLTQHAGLAEDTWDHRLCTRTVYINPVFQWLYMNMNYHIEHHSMPMVPYHALPKLHEQIKDQLPPTYPSLWAVYKEMIPALFKQAFGEPGYVIPRPLPTPFIKQTAAAPTPAPSVVAVPATPAVAAVPATPANVTTQWVEACAADDLDEEEVRRFTHQGKNYAIYRLLDDDFYATDALCTHEKVDLTNGLVINGCIECPMHNGRFAIATGKALAPPVFEDLQTYPVERRGDKIYVQLPA